MRSERVMGLKAIGVTVLVHGVAISSLFLFGFVQPNEEPPMIVDAALVEMAKLGDVLPDPKKLVRIEASKSIEKQPEKTTSLSRRLKKKKKKKPKIKPKKKKKPKPQPKKKKKPKEKPKEDRKEKKKKADINSLLDDELDDERADNDDRRIGFRGGHARGRSHDPNATKRNYAFELSAALRPHLKVPEVISNEERRGLQTKVSFKVSKKGKVVGKPRIKRSSGNRLFDNAALTAINYFAIDRPGKLPLPKDKDYRITILKHGITTNMRPTQ